MIPFAPKFMQPFGGARLRSYRAEVLADNPVALWELDESSGTLFDSVGSNDMTAYNAPTYGVTGPITGQTAVAFNGSNQYADVATALVTSYPLTLECWAYTSDTRATFFGLSRDFGSDGAGRKLLYLLDGNLYFYAENDSMNAVFIGGTAFPVNTWNHIAATCVNNDFRLYLNGSQVATSSDSLAFGSPNRTRIAVDIDFANGFNGRAAYCAIYNTALTPSRIAAHYGARNNP